MLLIVVVLCAFPIGYFVKQRQWAFMTFIAVQSFVFTFQSTELLREWVGHDYSAFPRNPKSIIWSYGTVNLVIWIAGFGLVYLGSRLATKRAKRNGHAVELQG